MLEFLHRFTGIIFINNHSVNLLSLLRCIFYMVSKEIIITTMPVKSAGQSYLIN